MKPNIIILPSLAELVDYLMLCEDFVMKKSGPKNLPYHYHIYYINLEMTR